MDMTIRKIAQLAGTSYSTVSRALNDSPLVKESTRERIQNLANNLGYQINFSARSLATGIRGIVGVVYPYHSLRPYESAFTREVVDRIRRALDCFDMDTLIAGFGVNPDETDDITRLFRQKKVDGLITLGYELSDDQIAILKGFDQPFLLLNPAPDRHFSDCHHIRVDQHYGGFLAGERLLKAGRTKLLNITESSKQFQVRSEGFRSACDTSDVSISEFVLPDGTYETAYDTIAAQMGEIRKYNGIFAHSDLASIGVLNCLIDNGVDVPGDISVIGYDDIEWAKYTRPALTTIHQPLEEMVELATESIVRLIENADDSVVDEILRPAIADRRSC